ncbi:MAG: stage II sporulation protein R [Clostridiales bacterium]|nr:stage II sporulation protein R [Clostridiales bacterium]
MKKKGYITAVVVAGIALAAVLVFNALAFFEDYSEAGDKPVTQYLRIHIRANSNSAEDQGAKYAVRDGVVAYLTPVLAECGSAAAAAERLEGRLGELSALADRILKNDGRGYGAAANIKDEEFPTRIYGDIVLEKGVYTALILELGEARGDNWWCIAFPPLCFIPAENDGSGLVKYRSKILEIIAGFFDSAN